MFPKFTLVLVWVICLSYKMVLISCEVVLVNRNITDSFRVGEDGCRHNESVCTNSQSTCLKSDGLCWCSDKNPNFRNARTKTSGDKNSYSCLNEESLRKVPVGGESKDCVFGPFQLIPYRPKESATKFKDFGESQNIVIKNCPLKEDTPVRVKFPNNATEMKLKWLNQSYVDLSVSNNAFYFKWKKSVSSLQGTVITFTFHCEVNLTTQKKTNKVRQEKCLRAKVFGIWSAGTNPTESTPAVTAKAPTTSVLDQTSTISMSHPTTSARSNSKVTIIVLIIVLVAAVLLAILSAFFLFRRMKKNSPGSSNNRRFYKEDDSMSTKQFICTESDSRTADLYEKIRDTNEKPTCSDTVYAKPDNHRLIVQKTNKPAYTTPNVQRVVVDINDSHGYATPNSQRVKVKAKDPAYATPNDQCGAVNDVNFGYATPDTKRVIVEANNPHTYATPDKQRTTPDSQSVIVEANPAYKMPDSQRVVEEADKSLAYATPDSQRFTTKVTDPAFTTPDKESVIIEANPAYETPDGQRVVVEANPAYITPDVERNEANSDNWNLEPGYQSVDMTKEANEVNSQIDPGYATPDFNTRADRLNSYSDPGYETPDVKKT